ncbi:MAG TPA: flagellar biosynthesis protein FlhB [Chloroflexota bacterium]|nr:flagellar biosynthesis protein FlhB [Chloroflexota bacterium]
MAGSGERTESATPKRRQEARERGQILKSVEVNTAALLVAGAAFLQWGMPSISEALFQMTQRAFETSADFEISTATVFAKSVALALFSLKLIAPIVLGIALVGTVANVGQFGFLFSGQALKPQFSRVNPLEGAKRIFSTRTLVELLKTVLKVVLVGYFAWQAVQDKGPMLVALADMQPGVAGFAISGAMMQVVWRVAVAFVVIAAADFMYQRWFYERSLRMSKEEIKEELKQSEGNPHIRARLRQRARALARQRMMQQVPSADVVITNPTHFAIAIKYESGMDAPKVIAKGERLIAQQIKKMAREHNVPMVENKPLAQALFKACQIGQSVPPELYKAVAEVLAFVYRLRPDRAPGGYAAAA